MTVLKPPTSVKIGPYMYSIQHMEEVRSDDEFVAGNCNSTKLEMKVKIGSPDFMKSTLLHEILHACWHAASLPSASTEESSISALEAWVFLFMKENPKVVKYLVS